jgi:hypothetical protein
VAALQWLLYSNPLGSQLTEAREEMVRRTKSRKRLILNPSRKMDKAVRMKSAYGLLVAVVLTIAAYKDHRVDA